MSRRNLILIAIVVLSLLAIGYRCIREADPYAGVPTDETTWIDFHCPRCDGRFHLDGREIQIELDRIASAPKGTAPVFRCKTCGEAGAQRILEDE